MTKILTRSLGACFVALLCSVARLDAQDIILRPGTSPALSGIVTDTMGIPLPNVDVFINQLQRRTRTRDDGTFTFDKVRPGTYSVQARSVGFVARSYSVRVRENGGTVTMQMIRIGYALPSMITTADRGGLSGVIGDTSFRALANVRVSILGKDAETITDSTGAFFLPLRPGHYMVLLERDGYTRQRVGVTIPNDEQGRKLAAWMVDRTGPVNPREGANLFELNQRIMRIPLSSLRMYTREEMERLKITELRSLVGMWAMKIPSQDCLVTIDGGPRKMPLWQLTSADIEFVEIFIPRLGKAGQSRGPTSLLNQSQPAPINNISDVRPPVSEECGVGVIAWLRQ